MLREALQLCNKCVWEKGDFLIDSGNMNKLIVLTVAKKINLLSTIKLKGFGLPNLNKVRLILNTANQLGT